jgi:hypothetical protein
VRQQHILVEWLGDVIVAAQFESEDLLQLTAARGDEDDGRGVWPLAEAPERVQAIHAGQTDVEEHQIGRIAVGKRERVLCASRSGYPVARSFKAERHAATKQDVIIDQQDVVRRHESISKSRLEFTLLWNPK